MKTRICLALSYLLSVIAANWSIGHVGTQYAPGAPHVLPVGFGLEAPSAVYMVGVTLVLRDLTQRRLGKPATFALIVAGAALSATFAPTLALASGVTFLAAETVDFAVFTATERFGLIVAVTASNVVSIAVDSLVFLAIAFGSFTYLDGQLIGKAWATVAALAVLVAMKAKQPVTT